VGHWSQISLGDAKKPEFSKFFGLNAKFLEVSRQNLLVAEVPNRYFGSRVTTRAELNEIINRSLRFCSFGGAHHVAYVAILLHKA
jgi:hypothetical protein